MGSFFFHSIVVFIPLISAIVIIGIVAIVAGEAGGAVKGLRVTGTARGAAMIGPTPTFIGDPRVRTAVSCRPILDRMAGCAVEPKQTGMIGRVAMTARAGGREVHELAVAVASLTGHTYVSAGQREVAAVVIEIRILPVRRVVAG